MTTLNKNLSTNLLLILTNLREKSNKIAIISFDSDQISKMSKGKVNKTYFDKNFKSNLLSNSDIEYNSDIKSENENNNNFTSTSSESS